MSQTSEVKTIIRDMIISQGVTDKSKIYTALSVLGIPRPTSRRIARDLRSESEKILSVLKVD